jgi:hypothetical protein
MNIILISGGKRMNLLEQTLRSMKDNAANWSNHTLTLVFDDPPMYEEVTLGYECDYTIVNRKTQGASASRNIGAGSIPKYRRQKYVMFCDDDCYFCPGWDKLLEETLECMGCPTSGHEHPFNQSVRWQPPWGVKEVHIPLLISSVHMAMPWETWDKVGFFAEPGGPGGSEDYDWCVRATTRHGIGFSVTVPQCVIHCGLTSSSGKQIVGYENMVKQNEELIKLYGLEGKVIIA